MESLTLPAVTVLIADDHPLMRQGIRLSLCAQPNLMVVGEASNGEEALERVSFHKADVLILDLDMPKLDGLSIVRELNRRGVKIGVIILTLHTGADLIAEAMELGVRGYIIKSSAVVEIVEAVRRVADGGSYLSKEAQGAMRARAGGKKIPEELRALTPLELTLVCAIAEGKTSRELAALLDLSNRTVENYRTRICSKLGLNGANALLRYALNKQGRLPPSKTGWRSTGSKPISSQ